MELRRLKIDNFRGLEHFDWRIPGGKKLICLIGPGDSGKTTILDAIFWLLGDRWSLPINVFDFHDDAKPIVIEGLLTDLPSELLSIQSWGLFLCGVDEASDDRGEPADGLVEGVHVRLTIDETFEPTWELVRNGSEERKQVRASERAKLGVAKFDDKVDSHLRWSNTSALSKVTKEAGGAKTALREATCAARDAMRGMKLSRELTNALSSVKDHAQSIGAKQFDGLRPGIDLSNGQYGGVSLHSGDIPLSSYGLGTKRLTALSIQRSSASTKSTFLIDELESGLEPHRTIGLLETFRRDQLVSQAIMTTHSQTVVEICAAGELAIMVRTEDAHEASFVPNELEYLHRSNPSPFLSQRIIVVEGSTEEGLMRELFLREDEARRAKGGVTSPALGVSLCNGNGGSSSCRKAEAFAAMGYDTCLVVDSDDEAANAKVKKVQDLGISVLQWSDGADVELALLRLLEMNEIIGLLNAAVDEGVVSAETIRKDLEETGTAIGGDPLLLESWVRYGDEEMRAAVHSACTRKKGGKDKGWFKAVRHGEFLGSWLSDALDCTMGETDKRLASCFRIVYEFAYGMRKHDGE